MVNVRGIGRLLIGVRGLNTVGLRAGMQASFVFLDYIHADHPPGSLEGHEHEKKDEHDLFHWLPLYFSKPQGSRRDPSG